MYTHACMIFSRLTFGFSFFASCSSSSSSSFYFIILYGRVSPSPWWCWCTTFFFLFFFSLLFTLFGLDATINSENCVSIFQNFSFVSLKINDIWLSCFFLSSSSFVLVLDLIVVVVVVLLLFCPLICEIMVGTAPSQAKPDPARPGRTVCICLVLHSGQSRLHVDDIVSTVLFFLSPLNSMLGFSF